MAGAGEERSCGQRNGLRHVQRLRGSAEAGAAQVTVKMVALMWVVALGVEWKGLH